MSLRIGLLCHRGVGGSARIAVDLGRALAERGHAVHLFARTRPMGMEDFGAGVIFHPLVEGDGHAPPTARLDADWTPADLETLIQRVVALVEASGLDVLHFHHAMPFAWVAEAVRGRLGREGPRVVGTLHGTDVSVHGRSPHASRLAHALSVADRLTTVSRSHADLATEAFGLAEPPELIPNFVDAGRFRPVVGAADHRPRIVHVSNFRPVKDPAAAVRIFSRVRRELDADLWFVGDGEAMPAVRSAVERAGVERHVRFLGLHPAVERVLPLADVLLLTSHAESFGLAALEAAACGVPAVGPRVGGLPEVIAHGDSGLLYEPGNEEAAAAAALRLLGDRRSLDRMRAEAVRRAALFSSDVVVPRYEHLYRRLLARDPRPAPSPSGRP